MTGQITHRRVLPRDTNRLVVTQSNDLAGSIQDMNLTEKRVLLLAAAVIRQADTELPAVRFDVADYRRIYGIVNNNLVNELLGIVPMITTRNIILPHGRSSRTSFSVVGRFTVVTGPDSETGRAYGVVELHRDMAQFFLGLDGNFFSMPLLVYSTYRSNYALRVGEILASRGRGELEYTVTFATDDLKLRLDCEHYANFAQFRRRVLEPAKRENDEIGYLTFDWDELKGGRSIEQVTFHVALRKDAWLAERQRADIRRIALDNKLRKLGFDHIPTEYFDALGHEHVEEIVDDVLARSKERRKTGNPIRNPGAYVRTRLDGEVERVRGMLEFSRVESDDEAGSAKRAKRVKDSQERFRLSDELVTRLNHARMDHALQVFESLEREEREDLTAVILKDIFSPFPTLIAPQLRPANSAPLPEPVRRMALAQLLERNGLVRYEGHLHNPRAFANETGLFEAYRVEDREAIIEVAVATDEVETR